MAYQDENIDFNSQLELQNPYNIQSGDLEGLLDSIADALIKSPLINTIDVKANQKFIRDGNIKTGQGSGLLALYQKDVEANVEDDLQSVANQINGSFQVDISAGIDDTVSISVSGGGIENGILDITNLVIGEGNPLNVSQFIPIQKQKSNVDIEKAEEFLDTNIFELLPESDTRHNRIIRFFDELNTLLPPTIPNFGTPVNRDNDENWIDAEQYSQDNSISYTQDNPDESNIDEEQAFIHRLTDTANERNKTRTIEEIYNTILPYLTDILEDPIEPQDNRPEYENQSSGYLQFRNPNQGIIVRNTNEEFIQGLDPSNPTWLTTDYNGLLNTYSGDAAPYDNTANFILDEAGTGFTITMWVRFLDKTSSGTLFNFGNPTRTDNPFGFKLETYVLNKNDAYASSTQDTTWGEFIENHTHQVGPGFDERIFTDSDVNRFVRLQVREFGDYTTGQDYGLRDSHVGVCGDITLDGNVLGGGGGRKSYNIGDFNNNYHDELRLLQSTYIPEDFNEWYFICASYNPTILEGESIAFGDDLSYNPDFWLNHVNPFDDNIVANSGYGNKCKVEIISRTDLLRARGFKV